MNPKSYDFILAMADIRYHTKEWTQNNLQIDPINEQTNKHTKESR